MVLRGTSGSNRVASSSLVVRVTWKYLGSTTQGGTEASGINIGDLLRTRVEDRGIILEPLTSRRRDP